MNIIGHKIFIVESLFDDDVEETHGQGRIRSGPELKPEIRLFGIEIFSRIDDDQFSPLLIGPPETGPLVFIRIGPQGIDRPEDDAFRLPGIITDRKTTAGD